MNGSSTEQVSDYWQTCNQKIRDTDAEWSSLQQEVTWVCSQEDREPYHQNVSVGNNSRMKDLENLPRGSESYRKPRPILARKQDSVSAQLNDNPNLFQPLYELPQSSERDEKVPYLQNSPFYLKNLVSGYNVTSDPFEILCDPATQQCNVSHASLLESSALPLSESHQLRDENAKNASWGSFPNPRPCLHDFALPGDLQTNLINQKSSGTNEMPFPHNVLVEQKSMSHLPEANVSLKSCYPASYQQSIWLPKALGDKNKYSHHYQHMYFAAEQGFTQEKENYSSKGIGKSVYQKCGVTPQLNTYAVPEKDNQDSNPGTGDCSRGKKKRVLTCVFCHNAKGHSLRDTEGRVTCPVLRNYVCPICHETGDYAHTKTYCPKNRKNLSMIKRKAEVHDKISEALVKNLTIR